MKGRYAIYFTPDPRGALWRAGSSWLGRDAVTGAAVEPNLPPALGRPQWRELTEAPRRSGFHATLKPPFRLAHGFEPVDLVSACEDFARSRAAFFAPPLRVADVDGFIALTLHEPSAAIDALARDCVSVFDRFRAPPSAAETTRRQAATLTRRQGALLLRWGYPYVMEEFRFHLTLTERMNQPGRAALLNSLAATFDRLTRAPVRVDGIALFFQPSARAPFAALRRFPFGSHDDRAKRRSERRVVSVLSQFDKKDLAKLSSR